MNMQTNIDDVRAEIMRLEAAPHFDAAAWSRVLADLEAAGRFSALADAQRRMETARSNQAVMGVDWASGPDKTVSVAVETGDNADRILKAYWVQVIDDEWGMWIHAESAGKAKKIYLDQDPSITHADFVAIRATRPAQGADLLDCTPFTDHTLHLAGYFWDEAAGFKDTFLEFCPCSMCKAERLKPTYRMTIKQMVEA